MKSLFILALASASLGMAAEVKETSYLIKFKTNRAMEQALQKSIMSQGKIGPKLEVISDQLVKISGPPADTAAMMNNKNIEYVQPDYPLGLIENFSSQSADQRAQVTNFLTANPKWASAAATNNDNPAIPLSEQTLQTGQDPLLSNQWGMLDMGGPQAWTEAKNNKTIIVGVIDSGVDYTHPDLIQNMWKNPGEIGLDAASRNKSNNGIDDDRNGYVDDIVGYDFVKNDAFPYDKSAPLWQVALMGKNPGHGTHCAGNIAAKGNNGIGISGVAPNAQIMALRFISESGRGSTSAAIKAIRYGVDNGAKILNNSWGSIGEDPKEDANNRALRETIQYAESKGVLFIVAAGNGINGKGYDNDNAAKPSYPASYTYKNIISVAAIDAKNQLGSFSNYGAKSVHIAAPGVRVFSTVVGGKYSDQPIPYLATWDGTSMAAPHVAGAAALYWAQYPDKTMAEVKEAIIKSAIPVPALQDKTVSGGKLNLISLLKYN